MRGRRHSDASKRREVVLLQNNVKEIDHIIDRSLILSLKSALSLIVTALRRTDIRLPLFICRAQPTGFYKYNDQCLTLQVCLLHRICW